MKHRWVLMPRDEVAHCDVEMKRCPDGNRRNHDSDKPIKSRATLHKCVPARFAGRYFESAVEIRNTQLRDSLRQLCAFSPGRNMELSINRSGRTALCRSVAGDD